MTRLLRALALAALLAALALLLTPAFACTLRAQQPATAPTAPAAPADTTLLSPESTVRAVYRLVSFGPGERTEWAPVRSLFVPEAVIVLRTTRTTNTVFTLDGFINDFIRFDTIPAVARSGFREDVVRLHSTVYRDIAHVLVLYEAQVLGSTRPPQRGLDSWELVRREGRWWIVAITNDIVTPDAAVPAETAPASRDSAAERAAITRVIHNSIGWAITRDTTVLYAGVAHDSTLFIYHPDAASTIRGYQAFRDMAQREWLATGFRGTRFTVKDLALHLSRTGDAAWFSALLDDYGEVGGRQVGWSDCRWTGVLERQTDGRWAITQMHFSFPR